MTTTDENLVPPANVRRPAFINGLTLLPVELVHKVLDDLPLIQVLKIISCENAYINECVLSHIAYGKLFVSERLLKTGVPREIHTYSSMGECRGGQLKRARFYMAAEIRKHVFLLNEITEALSCFASEPIPDDSSSAITEVTETSLALWRARWTWLTTAKRALNQSKANHRLRAASLLSTHPGKLQLKKPLDPSQGPARPNTAHIVNRLEQIAKKIVSHQRLYESSESACRYRLYGLILVPYDRFLRIFLEGVRVHPLETFAYPADIKAKLQVVLDGLANIYPDNFSPRSIRAPEPRVDWTTTPPTFAVVLMEGDGERGMPHRCAVKRTAAYDARELDWLEAFLIVVSWMEENFEFESENVTTAVAGLSLDT
ncbi:hypothetical protein VTL71DRAFT_810 [Oculimacula yallundae]|uniref:F-box domain-containing protein n=1 Tax=Oculimacula yallundae TaxID=86028 RepID=A0ABR4D154_9HELO